MTKYRRVRSESYGSIASGLREMRRNDEWAEPERRQNAWRHWEREEEGEESTQPCLVVNQVDGEGGEGAGAFAAALAVSGVPSPIRCRVLSKEIFVMQPAGG